MMGAMDHDEVRELLQDAAVEPGGLERLMAGDTPNAAIVAGHLAGCPECTDELERLRRTVGVVRPAVRATPPPGLRQRTLDYVAAVGRPRGPAGQADPAPVAAAPGSASGVDRPQRSAARRVGRLAAIAAAIVLAIGGTAVVVNAQHDAVLRMQTAEIDALGDVARWTLRIDRQPDVRRIALTGAMGAGSDRTTGTLVFSPTSKELVVVADALTPAPPGTEYRCWVEVDGYRRPIGKMFFGGALAYWVGDVPEVSALPANARFGVSLVELGASGEPGEPVLTGVG